MKVVSFVAVYQIHQIVDFDMLITWLDFGHRMLIFLIFWLKFFLPSKTVEISGFRTYERDSFETAFQIAVWYGRIVGLDISITRLYFGHGLLIFLKLIEFYLVNRLKFAGFLVVFFRGGGVVMWLDFGHGLLIS